MKKEPYYQISYTVGGTGLFPLDMLRYDRSCPESEADSNAIESEADSDAIRRGGPRQVHLLRFARAATAQPNRERWESFGWHVLRVGYYDGSESKFPEALEKFQALQQHAPSAPGYPPDWANCPGCGQPAMDGHITCGNAACGPESRWR